MMHYVRGPLHGAKVVLEEGWPAPAAMSHRDYDTLGHYRLNLEDGDYHWVDAPLPGLARRVPKA
jgi:hypothetical protein